MVYSFVCNRVDWQFRNAHLVLQWLVSHVVCLSDLLLDQTRAAMQHNNSFQATAVEMVSACRDVHVSVAFRKGGCGLLRVNSTDAHFHMVIVIYPSHLKTRLEGEVSNYLKSLFLRITSCTFHCQRLL